MKRALSQRKAEIYTQLKYLDRQMLATINGFIGHLLYVAGDRYKCISRLANGKVKIRRKFRELVRESFACIMATTGLSKYVRMFHSGKGSRKKGDRRAWFSRPKLIEVQNLLEGWGLFKVDSPGFGKDRRPTKYFDIKVADLLIIAEVIESLLADSADSKVGNLSVLPGHKNFYLVSLFNFIFKDVAIWRREDKDWEATLPIWELSLEEEAAWEYRFGRELSW